MVQLAPKANATLDVREAESEEKRYRHRDGKRRRREGRGATTKDSVGQTLLAMHMPATMPCQLQRPRRTRPTRQWTPSRIATCSTVAARATAAACQAARRNLLPLHISLRCRMHVPTSTQRAIVASGALSGTHAHRTRTEAAEPLERVDNNVGGPSSSRAPGAQRASTSAPWGPGVLRHNAL